MKFATPFHIENGYFYDRNFNRLEIFSADYTPVSAAQTEQDFLKFRRDGIHMIRLSVDETALTDADGHLTDVSLFDHAVEHAFRNGFYLILIPVTKGNSVPFTPEGIGRQQFYLGELFTHENFLSGKCLPEYENIVGIEMLYDMNCFTDEQFNLYTSRVVLQVYVEHYFCSLCMRLYCLDRGTPSPERLKMMRENGMQIVSAEVFAEKKNALECEPFIPGIRDAVMEGLIRPQGEDGWRIIAIGNTTSISNHPHQNGGAEGFLTYAADGAVDFRITFPHPVRTAKFRPSMRSPVPVRIDCDTVEFTLKEPRYGVLEINYFLDSDPAYTVYVLGDGRVSEPEGTRRLIAPGIHAPEDLKCGDADILCFLPGLHDISGRLLYLESNKKVWLSRGTTVRAGVIAEGVENAGIYGQGILDGSKNPRDVGENKGDRMGEKWIEDAGREGFICFYRGKNLTLDGPVIYNPQFWNFVISGVENAVVRNHKAVSWIQNNDGIQPRSCTNLLVEHCFLKCNDDCIAVKTRRTLPMISRHYVFRDLVLWNDKAGSALEIGHTSQGDLLEDLLFENIEVVCTSGGVLHMYIIDHSTVNDVRYENIWVEGKPGDNDFCFLIRPSYYTTDRERGRIRNVSVKNYYSQNRRLPEFIGGFDGEHLVENVTFENIFFEYGKKACSRPETIFFWEEKVFCKNIIVR